MLNDEGDVAPATRERVLAACEELGYTRSNLGRSLKTGATGNIGVAIMSRHAPVILNPFYTVVIGGIEQELSQAGLHLLLSSLKRRGDLLALAQEGRVDGLLVVGCDIDDEDLENLRRSRRPVVLIDHQHPGLPSVSVDHEGGGRLAAQHLLGDGVDLAQLPQVDVAGLEPDHASLAARGPGLERLDQLTVELLLGVR